MNITLIGMPGSGKSLVGAALARHLDWEFMDVDHVIEKWYSAKPQQLIDAWSEQLFLECEEHVAIGETLMRDKIVIAPGGSIVYSDRAMAHFKKVSSIAYLEAPLTLIKARIGVVPRGIIGIREKSLAQLYAERIPLYERYADVTFDARKSVDVIASAIAKAFSAH